MKRTQFFIIIIIVSMFSLTSCKQKTTENKKSPQKLEDLYTETGESNRIYIQEGNKMIPYLVVSDNYNENALLLREFLLKDNLQFNNQGPYSGYYKDSTIDKFLNNNFYNEISKDIRETIIDSDIEITAKESLSVNGKELSRINRKIFLLSYNEMNGENSRITLKEGFPLPYFASNLSRIAYYETGKAGTWWLRTPSTAYTDVINGVSLEGWFGASGMSGLDGEYKNGIRPSFVLNKNIDIEKRTDIVEGESVYTLKIKK